MLLFQTVNEKMSEGSALTTQRLPTFYPSAASCRSETDGKIIGTCLRSQWFRCKGYEESNPPGVYSQWIFAAGIMWEKFLTEKMKEAGLFLGSSIKHQDLGSYVSGEIDILIKDPDNFGKKIIIEAKSYGAQNYQAKKDLIGAREYRGMPAIQAKPKDQNLLQAFLYLNWFEDQDVSKVILPYLDRSCSGPDGNAEFHITNILRNGRHYPVIKAYKYTETTKGVYAPYENGEYTDWRVSFEGIMERYKELLQSLQKDTPPTAEYQHVYSDDQIELKFSEGEIAKTKYENWKRDPKANKIGDWQCAYCSHKDTCAAYKEDEGVL